MPQVKVWNDNVHPYKETFREQKIEIPAKGFIKMDAEEAHLFKGTFAGILRDADNNPDPRGYKMIRIEAIGAEDAEPAPIQFISQVTGEKFTTQKELDEHLKQFKDRLFVDEEAEEEIKVRKQAKKKGAA